MTSFFFENLTSLVSRAWSLMTEERYGEMILKGCTSLTLCVVAALDWTDGLCNARKGKWG